MWPDTYELFEFNKMWFVFYMSILIAVLWIAKMVIQKKFEVRRTPLDIPLLLFLLSQIISTIFSMDPHVSFWGYYSRFNGGLLSTIAYIFLYYAFATNLINPDRSERTKPISYKLLLTSLFSGLAVVLWGLPSHYGTDPTCLFFRGTFDVSCWTADFQPTIRIFSTLGQPNWLGTFLAALLPIAVGFGLTRLAEQPKKLVKPALFLILAFLFYLSITFTRSQSSFVGFWIGAFVFVVMLLYKNLSSIKENAKGSKFLKYLIIAILICAATSFFIDTPIGFLNQNFTLVGLEAKFAAKTPTTTPPASEAKKEDDTIGQTNTNIQLGGGSESSDIRLIVWKGALEIFKQHPLFGTGVETYAYAYYQVKPVAHNLTSEWDYLYNKAHNEYLNYLATTGAFGLGTYLLIIGFFAFYAIKTTFKEEKRDYFPISAGIIAGYIAILISNFFGFSVVVVNLFLFIFPLFFFELEDAEVLNKTFGFPAKVHSASDNAVITPPQSIVIVIVAILGLYYEVFLFNYWRADRRYALGNNLDKVSQYAEAYQPLSDAVKIMPSEDQYKDELSINMATISLLLAEQKQNDQAIQFGQQAKELSDGVVARHPNNVVFLKTRARVLFALSEINPSLMDQALATIEQARKLAPTDAKLVYNEGLFYNQKGDTDSAIKYINDSIKLKPNYLDAYNSLSVIYAALVKKGGPRIEEYKAAEKQALDNILTIDPKNKNAKDMLKNLQ